MIVNDVIYKIQYNNMMGKIEEGSAVGTVVHGYTKVVGKYNSAVCI